METIKLKIIKLILHKFVLGYLVKGWNSVKGYKTQIFAGLTILTYIGQTTGVVPKELADQLYTVFWSGAGFSFIQKMQRWQPLIDETIKDVKEKSK